MRIQSVTAHAFGPLRDETLAFAHGMTVVVGDNESGKSSWHAATFAALCGRRRGRGRPREDEQRFADLHKPWDHDDWSVTAQISLDDGRRIELRHDLAGKVDCQAYDLDIGQDASSEVMHEGAPDGSRWLGLDRSTLSQQHVSNKHNCCASSSKPVACNSTYSGPRRPRARTGRPRRRWSVLMRSSASKLGLTGPTPPNRCDLRCRRTSAPYASWITPAAPMPITSLASSA